MMMFLFAARYVDQQKRELIAYMLEREACDAEHAIELAGVDVKRSILRALVSRNIIRQSASGRFYLDPSRMHEAYGASNRFILFALGATILGFLIIMLW